MTTDVDDAASAETAATGDKQTREVRYALVLNGGVSLAVWMGGVTHELNRLRLASEDKDSDSAWRKILDAARRTATIDLVAGTSAGGLNGAVLATAIARGGAMPNMREKWTELASLDVGKLTRSKPHDARSVLDGGYLKERVRDVLAGIECRADRARECTLFTTTTALDTRDTLQLANGRPVATADGRRVYKFVR